MELADYKPKGKFKSPKWLIKPRQWIRSWLGIDKFAVDLHNSRWELFQLQKYVYNRRGRTDIQQLRDIVTIKQDPRLNKED